MTREDRQPQPAPAWHYAAITGLGALLFLPGLGAAHLFDWDEINFAECAREMIATGDYLRVQIDYQPFWEKPPLFIWLQVLSMKAFGVNEYAARLPNALTGVATLLTLLYIGTRVRNRTTGLVWVVLYAASWLPHFYFKSGIIDPLFNLFIFLSFFQAYLCIESVAGKGRHAVLAGLFLGLAVLTKGPVAILVSVLALYVYRIVRGGRKSYSILQIVLIALTAVCIAILTLSLGWLDSFVIAIYVLLLLVHVCLVLWPRIEGLTFARLLYVAFAAIGVTALWFGAEIAAHGWWFVQEFITYQIRLFRTEDADHGGPFFYHFIVLFVGCFPASVFLFQKRTAGEIEPDRTNAFRMWMWIMFWVVLILFSIVKTKIVHYSSLCYFPLTFLAAHRVAVLWEERRAPTIYARVMLAVLGILLAIAITALPVFGLNKERLAPLIDDPFAVANLQAAVPWSYAEAGWGILYLVGVCASLWWMRKSFRRGAIVLAAVQMLTIFVAIAHFTPKIEGYSQRAAINFFKSLRGKDVYVRVLGYKSYAHLFYTQKRPQVNLASHDEAWLLNGPVDKPTYFVAKVTAAEPYRALPQLEVIGEEAGFVFFRRR